MLKHLLLGRCRRQSQIFFSVNMEILKFQVVDPGKNINLVKLWQAGVIIAKSEEVGRDWLRLHFKFKVDVSPKVFNRGRNARHVFIFKQGFFVYDVRQLLPLLPIQGRNLLL